MKKIAIIGLFSIVVVACALLFWRHVGLSRDNDFREKVAGTWSWEFESLHFTSTFAADGRFAGREVYHRPKDTNTYEVAGSWRIKDGSWFLTVTSSTNPRATLPRTNRGKIVRIDSHEFVLTWHGDTNELVWNRVTQ